MDLYLGNIGYRGEKIDVIYLEEIGDYLYFCKNEEVLTEFVKLLETDSVNTRIIQIYYKKVTSWTDKLYTARQKIGEWVQKGREFSIQRENPFQNQTVALTKTQKVDLVMTGLSKNTYLKEDEKASLQTLREYLLTAPSLDFKRLYELFRTVRIEKTNLQQIFNGDYNVFKNLIAIDDDISRYHEYFHFLTNHKERKSCGLQSGSQPGYKLTEGMADLLAEEYYGLPLVESFLYSEPAIVISMLSEIIGADKFHIANNTGDLSIVSKALFEIHPVLSPTRLYVLTDLISDLSETGMTLDISNLIAELLEMLNLYYEAKFDEPLKENKVMATYGNLFCEDATESVFVPHFNPKLKERFKEPLFYSIDEEPEELKEFQKQHKISF